MRSVIVIVSILLGSAALGAAQETVERPFTSPLTAGSRVRVSSTVVPDRLQGVVLAVDETTLMLALDDRPPLKIPVSSIMGVEVGLGRKSNAGRYSLIGAAGMALLGLSWSVDRNDCGDDSPHFCSRLEAVGGGALLGLLLGRAIGAFSSHEVWSPVTITLPAAAGTDNERPAGVALSIRL